MNLEIHTQRLVLRPLLEKDAEAVFAYGSDPEVANLTSWDPFHSLDDTKAYILNYCQANYLKGELHPLGIEEIKNPGLIIGSVSSYWDTFEEKTMSIGAVLSRDKWGQGIILEALNALIQHALKTTQVRKCSAPRNLGRFSAV
jgi:ribosomal-protein-alanine N-acetyltransferase